MHAAAVAADAPAAAPPAITLTEAALDHLRKLRAEVGCYDPMMHRIGWVLRHRVAHIEPATRGGGACCPPFPCMGVDWQEALYCCGALGAAVAGASDEGPALNAGHAVPWCAATCPHAKCCAASVQGSSTPGARTTCSLAPPPLPRAHMHYDSMAACFFVCQVGNEDLLLRVGVRQGGCSGMSYV